MSNFLKFIEEDTEAKKVLISTMPTKTKRDIKKYNEKINTISEKYSEYYASVKKYVDTKSKSFDVKKEEKTLEELNNNVTILENVRFILNPTNTYVEKMGFDNLLYQISNYYDFNFSSLNDIINKFLEKFELAEVNIVSNDFNYTCYVHEYMTAFLEVRKTRSDDYDKVSEIFERIYWVNPELIHHIELNFRKLIKKHEKGFNNYLAKIKTKVMEENKITTYNDCIDKLKVAYNKLNFADKETISDIVKLSLAGTIDINNYFEDSKTRINAYSSLMVNPLDIEDKVILNKFYGHLERLKHNVDEYVNYVKFLPLITDFKTEYFKQIPTLDKQVGKVASKNAAGKDNKGIDAQIAEKEQKLEKINKKVMGGEPSFFDFKNSGSVKQMKMDSVVLAKELYELYKLKDMEDFKEKVISILRTSLTVSDLLHLYYSFDYFKKIAIKKVFNVDSYEEITKYSESFDLFAMNPTNIIIDGVPIFEESNIARVIVNKYRLSNINLKEEDLGEDELKLISDKIEFILRINEIEKSEITVEKIWFMVQVAKLDKTNIIPE